MDSPQRMQVDGPRWTGDFTLPRLRAKLANKYLLHPDVEPDYLEVYRSDLSQMAMVRNVGGDPLSATWTVPALAANSRSKVVGSGSTWHLTRDPAAATMPAWRTALAEQRHVTRVASVPTLGVKRAERAPASLQRLPSDHAQSHQSLPRAPSSPQLGPGIATSPSGIPISPSAEERGRIDKDRQTLAASKRVWSAAHGLEKHIDKFMKDVLEEDESIKMPAILSRLSKEPFPAMKVAIKAGGDINWRNPEWDGATLLLKSVRTRSWPIAMYMLAIGADYTVADDSGRGLLHWAALEGADEFVEYFLEFLPENFGVQSVNVPDNGGDRPLHLAAYRGHLGIVRQLMRAGAAASLVNGPGHTAAELAQAARMWHVVGFLMGEQVHQQGLPDQIRELIKELKTKNEPAQIRDLMRPCDVERAVAVREAMKDMPKPKPKKDDKKKK